MVININAAAIFVGVIPILDAGIMNHVSCCRNHHVLLGILIYLHQ